MSRFSTVTGAAFLVLAGPLFRNGPGLAAATARDSGFKIERRLGSLGIVTAIAFAPDGTLFMAEKTGLIRVLPPGATSPRDFAAISVYTTSECGLLGLALGPDYAGFDQGGHVYVFASVSSSEQRILRFLDSGGVGVERTDIKTGLPTLGANHDGGCLKIGPDGKLYTAIGDGGSGSAKSQDLKTLHGKAIRLNLDGSIPGDNPDFSAVDPAWRKEIFAYGFRNPFRLALRRTGPGASDFQLFVNDVGSAGTERREEVNLVVAGKNYGWPNAEGVAGISPYVDPLHAYNSAGNCIAGGVFYGGLLFPPAYRGSYFFMDYGSNKVFRMTFSGNQSASVVIFADAEGGLIDIAEAPDGSLHYSTYDGQLFRITYSGAPLSAAALAEPAAGSAPLTVRFTGGAAGGNQGPYSFTWDFADGGTSNEKDPEHTFEAARAYTVRLTASDGIATSFKEVEVLVEEPNLPPAPEILAPAEGSVFDAGATVEFSGRATDPEDVDVPPESLRWDVILEHLDHVQPWLEGVVGAAGSFSVPEAGIEENWSFLIRLTATDSRGKSATAERSVSLDYIPIALGSSPSGLRLTADGVSIMTPGVYQAVKGARVEVGAPSPQPLGPGLYRFAGFSDAGGPIHEVVAAPGLAIAAAFEPDPAALFIRGDSNRDGAVNVTDVIFTLAALFTGGEPWPCPDAADANDDGDADITDAIATLFAIFLSGEIPEPAGEPGFDPTPDGLICAQG